MRVGNLVVPKEHERESEVKAKVLLNSLMTIKVALTVVFTLMVTVILAWQPNAAEGEVVTDGLVSYWTFDEADIDGQTAKDAWGDNDGKIMGNPQIVEGKIGKALLFDGVDDYVEVEHNDSLSLDFLTGFSIEAWVYPKAAGVKQVIVSKEAASSGNDSDFQLMLRDDNTLRVGCSSGGWTPKPSLATYSENNWYHLVGVHDGENLIIYVNGQNSGVLPGVQCDAGNKTGNVRIGTYTYSVNDVFNGIIDEVRIYSRALSEDEVKQNLS
jgi:hypothetical protein